MMVVEVLLMVVVEVLMVVVVEVVEVVEVLVCSNNVVRAADTVALLADSWPQSQPPSQYRDVREITPSTSRTTR